MLEMGDAVEGEGNWMWLYGIGANHSLADYNGEQVE
jgi:hypothetical protein